QPRECGDRINPLTDLPSMMELARFVRVLFALGICLIAHLTVGDARATLVPGSRRTMNDCLVEADVADAIADRPNRVRCTDGETCDHDQICANRSCRFRLRVCVNQSNIPGCAGRTIRAARAVVKLGRGKKRLPLPADMTSAACGPFVDVDVPSDAGGLGKGKRKGKTRPNALALLRRRGNGVDVDRIPLSCSPRPGPCAPSTSQDPITPDHPLWIAMKGEAVVDGV